MQLQCIFFRTEVEPHWTAQVRRALFVSNTFHGEPMSATERRHVPRTKLDKLAYIHIEPNNGGIVLNVSGDGLAFHSMAPVEKNGPVHFSLKEQNRRIDVCGELIWTDTVQKIGGLRFTTLTSEARDQIENWMTPPEPTAEHSGSSLGAALLRAFPSLRVRRLVPKLDANNGLAPLKTKVRLKMSGFSGGLATGLLISMLTSFIFLLSYIHRQQIGESLIHMGERLASRKPTQQAPAQPQQTTVASSTPLVKSSVAVSSNPVRPQAPAPSHPKTDDSEFEDVVHIQPPPAAKPQAEKDPRSVQRATSNSQPSGTMPTTNRALQQTASVANEPASVLSAQPKLAGLTATGTGISTSPLSSLISAKSNANAAIAPAPPEPVGQVQAQSPSTAPALPSQWFFDLGKFKQQQVAQDLSDRVAQLGMRTSVVNKVHLWMTSYQVLVGPYLTPDEEKKIRSNLTSNGIKARPFERGSRDFAFRSGLTVAGTKLPVGDFTISWETYVEEAKVKFAQADGVLATADGKWITHPQKFAHNEYVYQNVGNGQRPLLEVHFAGLDRALVFR
jgi:hypothetical protein